MAVLNIPDSACPSAATWSVEYNTQTFVSDLNGAIQTAELPGARWAASLTFSNARGAKARALTAFLASLHGRAGRFYLTPNDWEPNGNPIGSPVVATDAQDGVTVVDSTGWEPSTGGLLVAGDYFELNGELKIVTGEVVSDSSGDAEVSFAPPLRKNVTTGMSFRLEEPRAVMMLADDDQASWAMSVPVIYAISIDVIEALDI